MSYKTEAEEWSESRGIPVEWAEDESKTRFILFGATDIDLSIEVYKYEFGNRTSFRASTYRHKMIGNGHGESIEEALDDAVKDTRELAADILSWSGGSGGVQY